MSTVIDSRLADRRRSVIEDGARRRLRRLVLLLFVVGLIGAGAWLVYHSSYLAIADINVDGQVESRATAILAESGVGVGVPTIGVDGGDIEAALLDDPWIAAASVRVTWPGSITVEILEYTPAGWVAVGDRWLLTAAGGEVLDIADEPSLDLPHILVGSVAVAPGGTVDAAATAGLEFIGELTPSLAGGVVVSGSSDELFALVPGHQVLLGYPTAMAEKARALAAIVASGVPAEAEINVVSPERPAVKPQVPVESSQENIGESQPSG